MIYIIKCSIISICFLERVVILLRRIDVALVPNEELPDMDCWLVLDLLRASSQIVTFFSLGGEVLLPAVKVQDALNLKKKMGDSWILMGERNGLAPAGFDMGNSPSKLKQKGLEGKKRGIICTSNGTQALLKAEQCGRNVIVASALNASHACQSVMEMGEEVGVLCAGKGGRVMLDDAVCAGMLVEKLIEMSVLNGGAPTLSDSCQMALTLWRNLKGDLKQGVMQSQHAAELESKGFVADLDFCCRVDVNCIAPRLGSWNLNPALYAE